MVLALRESVVSPGELGLLHDALGGRIDAPAALAALFGLGPVVRVGGEAGELRDRHRARAR